MNQSSQDNRGESRALVGSATLLVLAIFAVGLFYGHRTTEVLSPGKPVAGVAAPASTGAQPHASAEVQSAAVDPSQLPSAHVPVQGYPYPEGVQQAPAVVGQCMACHGPMGISQNHDWPNIAGQSKAYLLKQLQDIKSGARRSPFMEPVVAALNDAEFEAAATYFSAQQGAPSTLQATAPAAAAACMACHNPAVQGDPSWPHIAGQKQPYLAEQLHAFKSGKRKNAIMAPLVANLSDEDIAALSKHFAGL